jgi:hypothetical protein
LLLGQLTRLAWAACDSLAEDTDKKDEADAFDKLILILDSRFKRDKSTELLDACEHYFYKSNRKAKETVFEHIVRIRLSTKKILEHEVDLPDQVRGWLVLRRAGLSEIQRRWSCLR